MDACEVLIAGFPGRSVTHGPLGWSSVCLLRGPGEVVLVDTGPYAYRGVLIERLRERGLDPGDVTTVALTHLHWDHVANCGLFGNARVLVPRDEWEWAGSVDAHDLNVIPAQLAALDQHPRVEYVRAGGEVASGLVAMSTPGHTPGHVSYRALRPSLGDFLAAGDAVKNRLELVAGDAEMTMDTRASRASLRELAELLRRDDRAVLVPGHDSALAWRAGAGFGYVDEAHAAQVALTGPGRGPVVFTLSEQGFLTQRASHRKELHGG
jgi:N-acyl homoserine lactone hydrolase